MDQAASHLCRAYLDGLEAGDLDAVVRLFAADGVVRSPLYGVQPARAFYTALFADTERSETTFRRVLVADPPDTAIALHFDYAWTLADGTLVAFEVVHLIERDAQGQIAALTIIYDTAPLRAAHDRARRSSRVDRRAGQ